MLRMENLNENCVLVYNINKFVLKLVKRKWNKSNDSFLKTSFLNIVFLIRCILLVFVFQMPCEYLSLDTMEKWIVCKCVFKDSMKFKTDIFYCLIKCPYLYCVWFLCAC